MTVDLSLGHCGYSTMFSSVDEAINVRCHVRAGSEAEKRLSERKAHKRRSRDAACGKRMYLLVSVARSVPSNRIMPNIQIFVRKERKKVSSCSQRLWYLRSESKRQKANA